MHALLFAVLLAAAAKVETGTLSPTFANRAVPRDASHLTPPAREFSWRTEEIFDDGVITALRLTFPSPVTTPHAPNNTVWCEYFMPRANGAAKLPGVVVLHFLNDPGFTTTRLVCNRFARSGIAALLLKMPYYGERRPPEPLEDLFTDLGLWVSTFRQAVQDIRCAIAWLRARPEIDGERTGLVGISLGAMVGALVAAVEPNVKRSVLILGGGNIDEIMWTAPETKSLRTALSARGIDREATARALEPVEPVRFAAPLPPGTLLMINGRKDTTVPPACAEALAQKFTGAELVWYDTTHVGLVAHLNEVLAKTIAHLTKH